MGWTVGLVGRGAGFGVPGGGVFIFLHVFAWRMGLCDLDWREFGHTAIVRGRWVNFCKGGGGGFGRQIGAAEVFAWTVVLPVLGCWFDEGFGGWLGC